LIRQLRRENQLLTDKVENAQRALKELERQLEDLLKQRMDEGKKHDSEMTKERDRYK
jgi:predicted phage tail protein